MRPARTEFHLEIGHVVVTGPVADPEEIAAGLANELGRLGAAAPAAVRSARPLVVDHLELTVQHRATARDMGTALAAAVWAAVAGSAS